MFLASCIVLGSGTLWVFGSIRKTAAEKPVNIPIIGAVMNGSENIRLLYLHFLSVFLGCKC